MSIRVTCDACRATLKAEERHAGKRVRCPKCREPILVPAAPSTDDDGSEDFFGATEGAASSAATKSAVSSHVDTDFEVPEPSSRKRDSAPKDRQDEGGWLDLQDEDLRGEALPEEQRLGKEQQQESSGDDPQEAAAGTTRVKPRKKKRKKRSRLGDAGDEDGDSDGPVGAAWRQNLYWLLLLTLIPLCLHSAFDVRPFEERLEESLEGRDLNLEGLAAQASSVPELLHSVAMQLPDHKVVDAFLPADTWLHWVFAGVSAAAFFGLLIAMWPAARASPARLLVTGVITGTIGIMMLLTFQWIAMSTEGVMVRGRSILVLLFYIVKFIGFSYRCAVDPDMGFGMSFMGFVCGVGLCEEVCKALPIVFYLSSSGKTSWRGACLVGLASGIGFGISEGIIYSEDYYNGISGGWNYVVRFVSCVGLHALWAGAIGIVMYHNQDYISEFSWENIFMFIIMYLGIAMVLHGVYDTFLKKEMELWALVTAGISFGWFAYMVARARSAEAA